MRFRTTRELGQTRQRPASEGWQPEGTGWHDRLSRRTQDGLCVWPRMGRIPKEERPGLSVDCLGGRSG